MTELLLQQKEQEFNERLSELETQLKGDMEKVNQEREITDQMVEQLKQHHQSQIESKDKEIEELGDKITSME